MQALTLGFDQPRKEQYAALKRELDAAATTHKAVGKLIQKAEGPDWETFYKVDWMQSHLYQRAKHALNMAWRVIARPSCQEELPKYMTVRQMEDLSSILIDMAAERMRRLLAKPEPRNTDAYDTYAYDTEGSTNEEWRSLLAALRAHAA